MVKLEIIVYLNIGFSPIDGEAATSLAEGSKKTRLPLTRELSTLLTEGEKNYNVAPAVNLFSIQNLTHHCTTNFEKEEQRSE